MGLGLGSVAWDATGGWLCDEITPLLRVPAEARVIGYNTWMQCRSGDGKTEVGCRSGDMSLGGGGGGG